MDSESVVLHTCCGPCSCACVPVLKALGRRVMMYFANSNLNTQEEYDRRLENARRVAEAEGVRLEAEPYNHAEWLAEVAVGHEGDPEKGERCRRCYAYNLAKTAAFAQREGIPAFTTSLTVSPHKPSAVVFAAGHEAEKPTASFLETDFKKRDGFKHSLQRSAELGLYRQRYCGCEFSKTCVARCANIHQPQAAGSTRAPRTLL